jgi:transposase
LRLHDRFLRPQQIIRDKGAAALKSASRQRSTKATKSLTIFAAMRRSKPGSGRTAITFSLSPGNDHDAPHGRALLEELGPMPDGLPLLMDRAYEGNETRQLVLDLGMIPVVPPKSNRLHPWDYDHALYKKRNEIERLFRRLKGFRRIFSRFEKLDVLFLGFLSFALIVEVLRVV